MSTITFAGNLTSDPELRFIPSGAAVASFTVAENKRVFKKDINEWVDGEPVFWRCSVWKDAAEHVAESLSRGTRVIVTGTIKQEKWEKDGVERTGLKVEVDEIGPSLKYVQVKVAAKEPKQQASRTVGSPWGQSDDQAPF